MVPASGGNHIKIIREGKEKNRSRVLEIHALRNPPLSKFPTKTLRIAENVKFVWPD
jgi:hypothetical protein